MSLKTFSRSLLAMAITTAIAADPIVIDSLSGPGPFTVTTSDSVTVASGAAINTTEDGIEIDGVGLNIPFINVEQGATITAGFDGIFVTGTDTTVGEITIDGTMFLQGTFLDTAGVNIGVGNRVTGAITFSPTSNFTSVRECETSLFFCDGLAVLSTMGTTGDLLLQGTAQAPVGIQLAAFEDSVTGEIIQGAVAGDVVNSGALNAGFGIQILSGATVNGNVLNNAAGVITNGIGIFVSSERLVFSQTTGITESIAAGQQVNINGSILNSGTMTLNSAVSGIILADNVVVTGNIENSGSITSGFGINLSAIGLAEFSNQPSAADISPVLQGDIINTSSGNITSTFLSVFLADGALVEGSIVNRGMISSQLNSAIALFSNSSVGAILNDSTGTIDAGDDLILIQDSTVVGSIVNNGTLGATTFNGAGIDIEESTVGGGITNTGSINSQDVGIDIVLSDISGGITNSTTGTITSGEGAIVVDGGNFSGGITNDGVLRTNGDRHYGTIEIGPGLEEDETTEEFNGNVIPASFSGGINNTSNGAILNEATNSPDFVHLDRNVAVLVVATTVDGGIANAGDIESDTDDAILIPAFSSFENAVLPDTILNDGISNTGEIFSGGGAGIRSSGALVNGGINNSGNIEGKEGIVIDGLEFALEEITDPMNSGETLDEITAVSINANAGVTGDVTNSGLIRSTISAAEISSDLLQEGNGNFGALSVLYGASINGDIINRSGGRIEATGDGIGIVVGSGGNDLSGLNSLVSGGISGLPLTMPAASSVTGEINNSGSISSSNSIGIYVDNGSLGGIINNASGTITGGNGLAIKAELSSVVNVAGAAPSSIGFVTNAGTINGSIDFGNGGGAFNGLGGSSGAVIGASALTIQLADGATSDTTTQINGDFTFSGPITLDVKGVSVGGVNDPVYGVLSIVGAADLTGATLDIDVTADNFIDNGTELVFLDATTLTSDITSVDDNSAVLAFTVAQQGNSLVATAQRTAFEEVIAQTPGGSAPNVQAISSSLSVELIATLDANSELAGVVNQIGILPVEEMVSAFKSLEPEAVSSGSVGAISADGASAGTVNARMTALRGTGFSGAVAGDGVALSGFWMQLYDSNTDQDTIDEVDGFDADTYGIALGLDASLDGGYNVGVAFSYADTDMDSEGAENNSLEIESYRLTAYGSYNAPGYFVDAQVAYAINQYDGTRNLFNGLRATNDHDGDQYSLRMRVGKPIALENGLFVTLKASAEYTYLDEESYSEKGAGNAGLSVDTDDVDAFVLGAGIDLAYPITTANEITWIPELSLEVQRDLIGQEIEVDSNFVGVAAAAFTTEGANVEQTGINLGLGLRAFGEGDLSVSLRADYLYKKDYKNVSGSVTVRYGF